MLLTATLLVLALTTCHAIVCENKIYRIEINSTGEIETCQIQEPELNSEVVRLQIIRKSSNETIRILKVAVNKPTSLQHRNGHPIPPEYWFALFVLAFVPSLTVVCLREHYRLRMNQYSIE